jgi:hypothetical protein
VSKRKSKAGKDLPESAQMFRCFVDVRDLRDDSTRSLPVRTVIKLRLSTKKNDPPGPREEVVQIEDGAATFEGNTFDELVPQLRLKYPDGSYERTLRRERNYQAERAMKELTDLIVKAAVEKLLRETASPSGAET